MVLNVAKNHDVRVEMQTRTTSLSQEKTHVSMFPLTPHANTAVCASNGTYKGAVMGVSPAESPREIVMANREF